MALRILFVEKEQSTADLLVPSLQRKGYEVELARSLRQALARVRSQRPELLIVDVASFGPNGYSVSDSIRSRLPALRTILLLEKGHASAGSTADEFMTKPYTTRGLLHRVKRLADTFASPELAVGSLAFDPDLRILRKGDSSAYLRPKEGALLEMFMRNPGRVLTRHEIMKLVWETDYMGDTRTLSVHIRWLRKKIEDDARHPRFLRTVRGVGYRFEVPADPPPPEPKA